MSASNNDYWVVAVVVVVVATLVVLIMATLVVKEQLAFHAAIPALSSRFRAGSDGIWVFRTAPRPNTGTGTGARTTRNLPTVPRPYR